jgi:hypothetical protein
MYKYKELLADSVFAENRENCSFIWDNLYDEKVHVNEYDLTLFIKNRENEDFKKYQELHYQRAYEVEEIKELLEQAGLQFVISYDAFTRNEVREDSERIYIVAKSKK